MSTLAAYLLSSSLVVPVFGQLNFDPAEARVVVLMRHLQRERPAFTGTLTLEQLWDPRGKLKRPIAEETARRLNGVHYRGVDFAFYGYSPILDRYRETLQVMRPADEAKFLPNETLGPLKLEDYAWQTPLSSNKMALLFETKPLFLQSEGRRLWWTVGTANNTLKDGEAALLVSSHPTIESAVGVAAGKSIGSMIDMDEGAAFAFVFVKDKLVFIGHLPVPN